MQTKGCRGLEERKLKLDRAICEADGLEKSWSKEKDEGESEEAAVGNESDGRRKEIADKT